MKRLLAFFLTLVMICSVLNGCKSDTSQKTYEIQDANQDNSDINEIDVNSFQSLDDPALLRYVEDTVYEDIVNYYQSEDCVIQDVSAVYISKEYLEESAFNSQANIWFGYTWAELKEQFQGNPFVFSVSEDGKTVVNQFEEYDDTWDRVIKNVAIGTGVILVCVTVSVVTAGVGATTISYVFAASAKKAAEFALKSAAISAVVSGTATAIQTKDMNAVLKSAALSGSESFKIGAICGAVVGGYSEARRLAEIEKAMEGAPGWRQAELRAMEKYGGEEQLSYLAGKEVPWGTPEATRPDIMVSKLGGGLEAIEVKYYNLESSGSLSTLYTELEREVADRVVNLPAGTTQRIVLDVTGRGISKATAQTVKQTIIERLMNIYENIPVDIVGAI